MVGTCNCSSKGPVDPSGGIFVQRRYGIVMMSNQVGKWAVGFVSLALMLSAMQIQPHEAWVLLAMSSMIISFVVYLVVFIKTLRTTA